MMQIKSNFSKGELEFFDKFKGKRLQLSKEIKFC